jgi:hypothetical protein
MHDDLLLLLLLLLLLQRVAHGSEQLFRAYRAFLL